MTEGFQIIDISDPERPQQLADVACPGSQHDVSVWDDLLFVSVETPRTSPACDARTAGPPSNTPGGRVLLYVASYTATEIAPSPYGNACLRVDANGERHNKISVVEVPLDDPTAASVVEFFHSATFSWDSETVVFGDEAGGGTRPRCRAQDPSTLGALWFYDLGELDVMDGTNAEPARSHWKVPRIQGELPNCTMYNFNTLPLTDRNVLVSSAYSNPQTQVARPAP